MTAGRDGDAQAAADVAFNAVRVLAAGWDADAADGTGLRDGDRAMLAQHARQVRQALQGHLPPPLVPGIPLRSDAETAAMLRADLAAAEAQLAKWPRCPSGCSCRIGFEDDADRNECGCDGPCNGGTS